jgi:hypothetical protein
MSFASNLNTAERTNPGMTRHRAPIGENPAVI